MIDASMLPSGVHKTKDFDIHRKDQLTTVVKILGTGAFKAVSILKSHHIKNFENAQSNLTSSGPWADCFESIGSISGTKVNETHYTSYIQGNFN